MKRIIALFMMVLLICSLCSCISREVGEEAKIKTEIEENNEEKVDENRLIDDKEKDIASIVDAKLDLIMNNDKVMMSSNPYDYTEDNEAYDEIIALGNDALEYMLLQFEGSNGSGLRGYIMAIACSEILGENPAKKSWSTGTEWYELYIETSKE